MSHFLLDPVGESGAEELPVSIEIACEWFPFDDVLILLCLLEIGNVDVLLDASATGRHYGYCRN